ncbi:radial spoke head 10 homolog B [Pempheris klunzingeri]|uniref:radial spoke head 10 homolog B n=1 Tax=Pempheris klunzingeri TaxID=3127111 RepID=UPI0039811631
MTQGKEEKTAIENGGTVERCGDAELPQSAGERERKQAASCPAGLKVNPAEVNRSSTGGRAVSDDPPEDTHQLPTLFTLVILSKLCCILYRHEGETCEGQLHGEGVACFEGGHMYKGMFSSGLMNGPGVFTLAGGLKYEGEFVCNLPMGRGTYTWPDGSSYEGEVYNGIRQGTGTYKCAKTGVLYRGQWDQGKRHRKGEVYYNQDKSSWYKGDWVKNTREGWGVRCYPSGNIYCGEWKNNLRDGEGTMRWLKLEQQYVGTWKSGVQHGRGTHVWILKRVDGSQYSLSNQYIGDFVQGQRHGQGAFYYAGGAIYEGEWRNNKKHGKGKFTCRDGHVLEGEFVDDQMMTHNQDGHRVPSPLCGVTPLSGSDSLGSDMALNTEYLLDKIPATQQDAEREQLESVVLMHITELKSVYSFYSRLGRVHCPENTFLLTRLQLWRLLKDCNIHHHGITLMQIDHLTREDATSADIHSPFTPMLLCRLLSCLVIVAYHIYHEEMVSQEKLLAACFSKLMTDNILPNAKNVKGFLFRQPDCAVVAVNYLKKCWEAYKTHCKDKTVTYRQLLWMFKDFHLLDNNLTTARLLKIIAAESRDPSNMSCLDLEITFLEFFEVLLGSAEVKCQQASEGLEEGQSLSSPAAEARKDLPETEELSSTEESSAAREDVKTKVNERTQPTEHTEGGERWGVQTRGTEAKDHELDLRIQAIHQFFNHFFFPAFEYNQTVSRNMKEEKLQLTDNI